jgi:GxxExxY protein
MPIHVHAEIRDLDQDEFGRIAYAVMDHAFRVHAKMGRFFDEDVCRDEVSARIGGDAQTEVMIEVVFEDFRKDYFVDLLVVGGALFELKAVKKLGAAHRAQVLNYLLLCELSHAKLVNFRPKQVEHEFVNTHLKHADRIAFDVTDECWIDPAPASRPLQPWLLGFLRRVGVGLDVHLYEAAVAHVFGGNEAVEREIDIVAGNRQVGRQKVRLASPDHAFKVTTIAKADVPLFEDHARRFLTHTTLRGIHWINITRARVRFRTIVKE